VASEDEPALEGEEKVLAHRLDRLEPQAVDRLGDAEDTRAAVVRLRVDDVADERLEPRRRTMESVPLGHDPA
jgi:hypothetical protein